MRLEGESSLSFFIIFRVTNGTLIIKRIWQNFGKIWKLGNEKCKKGGKV